MHERSSHRTSPGSPPPGSAPRRPTGRSVRSTRGGAERSGNGRGPERGSRASDGGVHAIQDALRRYLVDSGLAAGMRDLPVYQAWSQAVGPELAQRARAVRLQRDVLTVEVASAPHLHELQNFTGEGYRRAANRLLGRERIARVVFKLEH